MCVLGQMMWMESLNCMIYLCSPKLRSLQELEERGLHLADIAQHDTTRDLILLNQQRLAEIELSNQLERKKEELRILSRNLEIEKQKSEKLLYAMLPTHVANQLKEGKRVEAGNKTRGTCYTCHFPFFTWIRLFLLIFQVSSKCAPSYSVMWSPSLTSVQPANPFR